MSDVIIPGFDDVKVSNIEVKLNKIEKVENCILISICGSIDAENVTQFEKKINKILNSGLNRILFDFNKVLYLSSTGIGFFINFNEKIIAKDGVMVIFSITQKVLETFELLGFDKFLKIEENLESAISVMNNSIEKGTSEKTFPLKVKCPVCSNKVNIHEPGVYNCPDCETSLEINDYGVMSPG